MYNEICHPNSTQYVVKKGDTLWSISQAFGVSVQSITSVNPGADVNNLQIGSTLCIPNVSSTQPPKPTLPNIPTPPVPRPPVTCPQGTFSYTVKAGDTFWNLSQAFGVNVQSIISANPGADANNLQIGSTLCIPNVSSTQPPKPTLPNIPTPPVPRPPVTCPQGTFPYIVKTGDTFWNLSQTYGVSVQSIISANPGVDANNLQIGSTLCIPNVSSTQPPKPTLPNIPTPPVPRPPVTCSQGTFSYTVKAGDTFWNLSQAFGVNVQYIISANPGVDANNLQIGSTLCIPIVSTTLPPTPTPPESTPKYFTYLIKRCDTICGIAKKFYVSVESILQINPDINPRYLQVGTYIYVPINCCGVNMFRYVVGRGDTLYIIANKFNICPSELIAANPNIDFQNLVRCQIICIPDL